MSPRVKPREPLSKKLDMQIALLKIDPVEIGDFKFPTGRWLEPSGKLHDAIVVEVESRDAIVALRLRGLLFDGHCFS